MELEHSQNTLIKHIHKEPLATADLKPFLTIDRSSIDSINSIDRARYGVSTQQGLKNGWKLNGDRSTDRWVLNKDRARSHVYTQDIFGGTIYVMLNTILDTFFEKENKDDLDRDLEKVLTYLQGHPIEASNETVIWEKLHGISKELGINPTQAEKIIELIKARFVVRTNLVDYSCVSDSTSSRVILTARPRKVGKLKKSSGTATLKESKNRHTREEELQAMQKIRKEVEASMKTQRFQRTESRQDRPRSFVIKGDGWTYEVKIMPGGWHSGGGGRRPHPIAYQVGSSLSGTSRTDYKWNSKTKRKKKRKK